MFESPNISIEEAYVLKRVLRGFRQLRSLILWKICDDAMLQILGVTCHNLDNIDIWKSTNATDTGIRYNYYNKLYSVVHSHWSRNVEA